MENIVLFPLVRLIIEDFRHHLPNGETWGGYKPLFINGTVEVNGVIAVNAVKELLEFPIPTCKPILERHGDLPECRRQTHRIGVTPSGWKRDNTPRLALVWMHSCNHDLSTEQLRADTGGVWKLRDVRGSREAKRSHRSTLTTL